MAEQADELGALLTDGWVVVGYSTVVLAAGAMVHSILLQKGAALTSISNVKNGGKLMGQIVDVHTPLPAAPAKRGIFG